MKIPLFSLLGLCCVLGFSGCATDGSAPEAPVASKGKSRQLSPEELAKRPPVVLVSIDSTYDGPSVIVNGFNAGYAPMNIYLEVDAEGRLPYEVRISVDPSGHSDARAAAMLGSDRGPQILTVSLPANTVPWRKIHFSQVTILGEGKAIEHAKPGTLPTSDRTMM
jgi:hypothetical protein